MIRRASSHQRLVSWDAFAATTVTASTPSLHQSDSESGVSDPGVINAAAAGTETHLYQDGVVVEPNRDTASTITLDPISVVRSHHHHLCLESSVEPLRSLVRPSSTASLILPQQADLPLKRKRFSGRRHLLQLLKNSPTPSSSPSPPPLEALNNDNTNNGTSIPISPPASAYGTPTMSPSSSYASALDGTAARTATASVALTLETLQDDVLLYLLSFLDLMDLIAMTQVNHGFRRTLLPGNNNSNNDAAVHDVWYPVASRLWPRCFHLASGTTTTTSTAAVTRFALQNDWQMTAAAATQSKPVAGKQPRSTCCSMVFPTNMPLLLRMATTAVPTEIDEAMFSPHHWLMSMARDELSSSQRLTLNRLMGFWVAADFGNDALGGVGVGGDDDMMRDDRRRTTTILLRKLPAAVPSPSAAFANSGTMATTMMSAIQYIGPIGHGDRCIRANQPLPRPQLLRRSGRTTMITRGTKMGAFLFSHPRLTAQQFAAQNRRRALRSRLGGVCRYNSHMLFGPTVAHWDSNNLRSSSHSSLSFAASLSGQEDEKSNDDDNDDDFVTWTRPPHVSHTWKPFVAPFRGMNRDTQQEEIHLTPRLVSYYEVSILEPVPVSDDDDEDVAVRRRMLPQHYPLRRRRTVTATTTNNNNACVAVGIATRRFSLHTRMPGWDEHSFGYHSDDAGLFHAAGHMIRSFGPPTGFGPGDTVGCGIDYEQRAIFYTLNGQWLGYAFSNLSKLLLSQEEWFPVVGLDSPCPVICNFGLERPFVFDLNQMIAQQQQQQQQQQAKSTNMARWSLSSV